MQMSDLYNLDARSLRNELRAVPAAERVQTRKLGYEHYAVYLDSVLIGFVTTVAANSGRWYTDTVGSTRPNTAAEYGRMTLAVESLVAGFLAGDGTGTDGTGEESIQ